MKKIDMNQPTIEKTLRRSDSDLSVDLKSLPDDFGDKVLEYEMKMDDPELTIDDINR